MRRAAVCTWRGRRYLRHRRSCDFASGFAVAWASRGRHCPCSEAGGPAWLAVVAGSRARSRGDRCRDPPARRRLVRSGRLRCNAQSATHAVPAGCCVCPTGSHRYRGATDRLVAGPVASMGSCRRPRFSLHATSICAGRCLATDHRCRAKQIGGVPVPRLDARCGTRGIRAAGWRRLRPRLFVAGVVGWPRQLAGRGNGGAARDCSGHRLAGAIILRPPCVTIAARQ